MRNDNYIRMKRINKVIGADNSSDHSSKFSNKSGKGKKLGIFAAAAMLVMTSITVLATTYQIDTTNIFSYNNETINALPDQFPAGEFLFKGGDEVSASYSNVGESSFIDIYVYKQLNKSVTNINASSNQISQISFATHGAGSGDLSATAKIPTSNPYYLVTGVRNNESRAGDKNGRFTQIKLQFYVMPLDIKLSYFPDEKEESWHKMTIHDDITIEECTFEKDGYECIGWSRTPGATTPEYVKGDVIRATDPILKSQFSATGSSIPAGGLGHITADNEAELTLYAVWKKSDSNGSDSGNGDSAAGKKETTQKLEAEGENLQVKGANYTVTSASDMTVAYAGPVNKKQTKYTVPYKIIKGDASYTVTSIAPKAFKNCKNAKKITISSSIEKIGNSAFEGCGKLTSIILPDTVKEIGTKAFYNCKKLSKFTVNSKKLKKVGKNALGKTKNGIKIKFPGKYKAKYKKLFKKCGAKGAKY